MTLIVSNLTYVYTLLNLSLDSVLEYTNILNYFRLFY